MKTRFGSLLMIIATLLALPRAEAEDELAPPPHAEWRSYVEALAPIGDRMVTRLVDAEDSQLRQELYRFLYSQVAAAYIGLLYASPEYPDFWPMFNQAFNMGFPNPDDSYYVTPIDGNGIYKVTGYRGTVRILDLQVGSGPIIPRGTGAFGPTLANYDFDKLKIRKDGAFEVIVSPTRPDGYTGDWWKLDDKATYLLVRQRAYDLQKEIDGRLAIERLDRPAIKPRPTAQEIEATLRRIPLWVEGWTTFSIDWIKRLRAQGLTNKLQVKDYSDTSGHSAQRYIEGIFELDADEALIIETEVPTRCRYWDFQLTDELWSSVDWMHRQSTLNGYTARLDKDGRFRAVISAKDSGVPNWIDTGGLRRGVIYGRWTDCSSAPTPTVTKLKVADVRRYLPADTPVVTPETRDVAIRLHRRGVQMRRRW